MVDAHNGVAGRCGHVAGHQESEAVAALHRAERRHMEHLVGLQRRAPLQARPGEQIAVALAEGVVHLGHDGGQRAVCTMGVPETHRVEHQAQHARIGVKPHLALRVADAFAGQQVIEPFQRVGAAVAVVTIEEGEGAEAVAFQRRARVRPQAAQGQQQEYAGVVESMGHRAQAPVPDAAEADEGLGLRRHAAPFCCSTARPSSASATARPERRPSSWKP